MAIRRDHAPRFTGVALLLLLAIGCGSSAPSPSTSGASTTAGASSSGSGAGSSTGTGSSSGTATGSGSGTGGTTGASPLHCPDGGLPGLSLLGDENDALAESCVIYGDLILGGSAALSVSGDLALTVIGNIGLSGTASLSIDGGVLGIGNLTAFEWGIGAADDSTFALTNSQLITNPSGLDNLTSTINASGRAKLIFDNATLDSTRNWLLANLSESSTLSDVSSTTPNEIYLGDQCTVSIAGPGTSEGLWLRLTSGSSGTLLLPNISTDFTWAAGSATGLDIGWNLTVTDAQPGVGIESHAGSNWTIVGADAGVKDTTIGLYLDPASPPSGPIALNQLPLGIVGAAAPYALSFPWSAQPQLTLQNVNLGPIAWQIYVGSVVDGGPVPVDVTISDSPVNEAVVTAGEMDLVDCNLQLAVLGAVAPGAVVHAEGDDNWSQTIQAENGGSILLDGSSIHGALFQASGGGQIDVTSTSLFAPDGNTPTCDFAACYAHMLTDDGRPTCSPFTNSMQLSTFDAADSSSTIDVMGPANQACLALTAGSYTPAILIDQGLNPAIATGQTGTASCTDSATDAGYATTFSAYPVQFYQDTATGNRLTPDAGYSCLVTVGDAGNTFQMTAPSCEF
jgi:hypothetical protein